MTQHSFLPTLEELLYRNAADVIEGFGVSLHFVLDKKFGESHPLGNSRREYFHLYTGEVFTTIAQREFTRREYPEDRPLPKQRISSIRPLAEKIVASMDQMSFEGALSFLGQLTGAWILACPLVIVRDEYFRIHRGVYGWVDSESFVLSTLVEWLQRELEYMYT